MRAILLFALLVGCDGKPAPGDAVPAPPLRPRLSDAAVAVDASGIDAEPVTVLEGGAAAAAIAAERRARDAGGGSAIRPDGVGPFDLGDSRADTLAAAGPPATIAASPRDPLAETITAPGGLRLHVLGGALVAVEILGPGRVTAAGIGVGAALASVVAAHGPTRPASTPFGAGVVADDLPGVVFVLDGPPGPGARVARVVVVGPEGD